jgi:hypothetical protein
MNHLKLMAMILFALKINLANAQNSQTIPNTCNPIKDAASLKCQLDYANIKAACDNPVTLYIDTDYINLGTLAPKDFPLIIPEGVTLIGTYNIFSVDSVKHKSKGTHIYFPYAFDRGLACSVSSVINPSGDYNLGSAFRMDSCSYLRHICLEGPKTDTKDFRFEGYSGYRNLCDTINNYLPHEGLSSGVLVVGDSSEVTDCEIFGFTFYGGETRDMIYNNGSYTGLPGTFLLEHNFIHNNKAYGFGYGWWLSGGSGQNRCVLDTLNTCESCFPNLPGDTIGTPHVHHVFNYDAPDEVGHFRGNVFFANKHDIAGTGNRNSYDIDSNTFSQRSADFNINRHYLSEATGPWCCNLWQNTDSSAIGTQSARDTLTRVGGNADIFEDNVFYRVISNIQVPYPNINSCRVTTYNYQKPELRINLNYFANPTSCDNDLDSLFRIELGGDSRIFHWNYLLDTNLAINEPPTDANTIGEVASFAALSRSPQCVIASGSITVTDTSSKMIMVGDTLYFDTHLCTDGSNNSPPNNTSVYMWNFNDNKNEMKGEIRTDNNTGKFMHVFTKPGIVNVNLMSIDSTTHRGSDLARQLITVKPDTGMVLSFWELDTYIGRQLDTVASCTPRVDDYSQPAPTEAATHMEVYASVNDSVIWHQDIAGDSGWQYIRIDLGQFFQPWEICKGHVEIGLRAVDSVDAERVRGVTLLIDDLYMNASDDSNAVKNGDLEYGSIAPNNKHPLPDYPGGGWDALDVNEDTSLAFTKYKKLHCEPFSLDHDTSAWPVDSIFYLDTQSGVLSTDEVHSGFLSFKTWIEPFVSKGAKHNGHNYQFYCETGRKYNPGYYKGLRNTFDRKIQRCEMEPHPRLSFKVAPIPAATGQTLKITTDYYLEGKKHLQLINPIGSVVYENEFAGNYYLINQHLLPGVYYVKLNAGDKTAVRKIIIIH